MADIDRLTYAYSCLKDAARLYDAMSDVEKKACPMLAAQIAIGHYIKMLVDSEVKFNGDGNVERRPHIRQTYPSR